MILTVATLLGVILNFTPVDPIKALFWSAVINGVIAVPIMVVVMLMSPGWMSWGSSLSDVG